MQITLQGKKVLEMMVKKGGYKEGMKNFHLAIKNGSPGSSKWIKGKSPSTTQSKNKYTSALGGPDRGMGDQGHGSKRLHI